MKGSWLVLERYALGECDADEAQLVEATLAADPDARAVLVAIRGDRRALPPLRVHRPRRWPAVLVLLAAAVLLVLGLRTVRDDGGIKGGTLSLEVVRLEHGLATRPDTVAVGDRLGLRLTCPPRRTGIDVVVFHGGQVAFPVDATTVICGNGVAVPGAFSVDEPGPLVACVAVDPLPGRDVLATGPAAADVCVEIDVR